MPQELTAGIRLCDEAAAAIVVVVEEATAAEGGLGGRRIMATGSILIVPVISRSISSFASWMGLSGGVSAEVVIGNKGFEFW